MRNPWLLFLATLFLAFTTTRSSAVSEEQLQRISTSHLLVFGKLPTTAEATAAEAQAFSVASLLDRDRRLLQADVAAQKDVVAKAYFDALGRQPTADEMRSELASLQSYTDLVSKLVKALAINPSEYDQVLNRAYRLVIRRDIYPSELPYWHHREAFSFAIAAAGLESWARRNQPGLMETSGETIVSIYSDFLTTVRISRTIAAEAFQALGIPYKFENEGANPIAYGHNIVAAGAQAAVSAGDICFVAVGSPVLAGKN